MIIPFNAKTDEYLWLNELNHNELGDPHPQYVKKSDNTPIIVCNQTYYNTIQIPQSNTLYYALSTVSDGSSVTNVYYNGVMIYQASSPPPAFNELAYNSTSWLGFTKGTSVTADDTGMTFTFDTTSNCSATKRGLSLKPNTKYGLLLNVVNNTLTTGANLSISAGDVFNATNVVANGVTGNIKLTLTSLATIANNKIVFAESVTTHTGEMVKIKNLRLFEIPTGSQLDTDFTNLTADVLDAKYPYKSVGKNLFSGKFNYGYINGGSSATALEGTGSTTYRTTKWIPVLPNTQYNISGTIDRRRWQSMDSSGIVSYLTENYVITTSATSAYIRVYYWSGESGVPADNNVQIEQGSVVTSYTPYTG